MLRQTLIAAMTVASFTTLAFAEAPATERPRYELRRIPMGPRPDRYVLQRVYRAVLTERPDVSTAQARVPAKRRLVQRWAGPHYIGPVWEFDRRPNERPPQ